MLKIQNKAFTLIETCVVLFIIGLISLFAMQQMHNYRARQAERLFFERFEATWHATREYVAVEPHNVRLSWNQAEHTLRYTSADPQYRNMNVPIPVTLICVNPNAWFNIKFNHDSGTKPQTLICQSKIDGHRYEYRVQMMWGMLHVKT
ncbi:type II secretion system protein [Latilactobacillus graminis]|uniref:type II secretion system protein n=1 Tax=Latilactobacillus graminis TaxID=60519 RepID=UPI000A693596|nr:type II secretion system protein [Latilactobacillus graminis]